MNFIKRILLNRNSILVFAVIMGLIIGDLAHYIKSYTIYILAVVMIFSTTGISLKAIRPFGKVAKIMGWSTVLNYFFHSGLLILTGWLLMPTKELFWGFVIIASSPPGAAIIPFTYMLKGNVEYSIIGVFGAFLSSIILAPLIISVFSDGSIEPTKLIMIMVQIIIIPFMLSRLLLFKKIFPVVAKVRGKIVDWGFALIIFTAVGLNRDAFFSNFDILFLVSLGLFISIFALGIMYKFAGKKAGLSDGLITSQTLLVSIKSSGYSAATALILFGQQAAVPSAVLSVFVLLFLLYLSYSSPKS